MKQPVILVISGSDSISGAGMQADIKTASLLGVYSVCAVTAVTAQNSRGIRSIMNIEPAMVHDQIEAVLEDVTPQAVKIGMLPSARHVGMLSDVIREHDLPNVVVDPILAATSGDSLNGNKLATADAILNKLAPLSTCVTPNIPEASFYLETAGLATPQGVTDIAETLLDVFHSKSVVLKGGHSDEDKHTTDHICLRRNNIKTFDKVSRCKIDTSNLHGSGCVFSSAMACFLALGYGIDEAFRKANEFVWHAIVAAKESYPYEGYGPLYLFPKFK